MATLHIEFEITDLDTWLSGYKHFAKSRRDLGIRAELVQRAVDDENCIVTDFEFETVELASAYLRYLREMVWAHPDKAPALTGPPRAMILERVVVA